MLDTHCLILRRIRKSVFCVRATLVSWLVSWSVISWDVYSLVKMRRNFSWKGTQKKVLCNWLVTKGESETNLWMAHVVQCWPVPIRYLGRCGIVRSRGFRNSLLWPGSACWRCRPLHQLMQVIIEAIQSLFLQTSTQIFIRFLPCRNCATPGAQHIVSCLLDLFWVVCCGCINCVVFLIQNLNPQNS